MELLGNEGKEPDFFKSNAEAVDDYFREAFATSTVGPRIRVEKNPYAIVALGGYGRKEQHIFSDEFAQVIEAIEGVDFQAAGLEDAVS